jgi:hypothetical protein
MNFRPLHDRVVVRRIEADEKTAGGIIIPDTAQEKPQEAKSSPLVWAPATSVARSLPSTSNREIACCLANGAAPRSRSIGKSF